VGGDGDIRSLREVKRGGEGIARLHCVKHSLVVVGAAVGVADVRWCPRCWNSCRSCPSDSHKSRLGAHLVQPFEDFRVPTPGSLHRNIESVQENEVFAVGKSVWIKRARIAGLGA